MAEQMPLQYNLDTEEELVSRLSTKGLKVLEVFSTWCGNCRSVLPMCKKIRIEKDDEAALTFLTIAAENCQQVDAAREHQGKSEPLFLLYRNGQLKAKVSGANVPLLASSILELTPANAEIDELEENPFYLSNNTASKDGSKGADKNKPVKKK